MGWLEPKRAVLLPKPIYWMLFIAGLFVGLFYGSKIVIYMLLFASEGAEKTAKIFGDIFIVGETELLIISFVAIGLFLLILFRKWLVSIFALVVGAGLFSLGLSTTQLPTHLATLVTDLNLSQTTTILIILIPYLILGCFVDGLSMILITMPIVFPIVTKIGFDTVLFGLLVTKAVEIGAITPPVGLNAFVVKSMAPDVELKEIFYGCIPFVVMELFIVGLLIAFPQIALFALGN